MAVLVNGRPLIEDAFGEEDGRTEALRRHRRRHGHTGIDNCGLQCGGGLKKITPRITKGRDTKIMGLRVG